MRRWLVRLLKLGAVVGVTLCTAPLLLDYYAAYCFSEKQYAISLDHFDAEAYKRGGAPSMLPLPAPISISASERDSMLHELLSATAVPARFLTPQWSFDDQDAFALRQVNCISLAQLNEFVGSHSIRSDSSNASSTPKSAEEWKHCFGTLYLMLRAQIISWQARVLLDSPRHWKSSDAVRLQVARELLEHAVALSLAALASNHRSPLFAQAFNSFDAGMWLPDKGAFNFAWGGWSALVDSYARLGEREHTKQAAEMMQTAAKQHTEAMHADGQWAVARTNTQSSRVWEECAMEFLTQLAGLLRVCI